MPNLFENGYIRCYKDNLDYEDVSVIEVFEFSQQYLYLIYCKETNQHYWSMYSASKYMFRMMAIIDVDTTLKICKNLDFEANSYKYIYEKNIYFSINGNYRTRYSIYLATSYVQVIPSFYKIINDVLVWNEYVQELNADDLDEIDTYVKKISHMREITDLVRSFL